MRTATYNLNLRVGAGIPPIVKVSQNDEGRSIGFRLFDGALAYFPGATAEVTITGTKPSGLGFTETCSVSGATATVETTLAMTQESGRINAELRISDGTLDIGTSNFILSVEPAPHPAGTTDGTTEEARTVLERCEQYAQEAQGIADNLPGTVEELVEDEISEAIEAVNGRIDGVDGVIAIQKSVDEYDLKMANLYPYKDDIRSYQALTKVERRKNYFIINGEQSTGNLLRFAIFNDSATVISSSAPTYANRPAWYSPINVFELGHRYYFGVRLVSGSYEWTGTSALDNFFDVRIQGNSNEVLYQSKNSEWTCTKIPEMVCLSIGKGTYNEAVFELEIIDVTYDDKYIPEKHAVLDSSAPKLKLFFVTDIHANLGAIVRLEHYAAEHGEYIDEIVNGGDTARYEYASAANSNYFDSALAAKALAVIGNHDSAAYDSDNHIIWWAKTQKEVYDRYLAPYISGWNVVQPENAAALGLNYYYKDYSLVRVIYLDAMFWDSAQRSWLVDVLESARVGAMSVICVAHGTDGGFTGDTNCNWTWYEDPDEVGYHSNLRFDGTAASAVDDFVSAGGEFVCWLTGHTHKDKIGHMTAYPNQFALIMNRSGGKPTETRAADYSGTLVVVDRVNKLVKLIRCGDTFDAYMRPKNTLCYNYLTQELISQT